MVVGIEGPLPSLIFPHAFGAAALIGQNNQRSNSKMLVPRII